MEIFTVGIATAFWLGILTSISPCPLATNIAAISFVGKKFDKKSVVLLSGMAYTFGRVAAYVAIAIIVVSSLLSVPDLARFFQKYLNIILGPLLIIVGLFLLEIIKLNFGKGVSYSQKFQDSILKKGIIGAAFLGFIFALSFCPVSIGLFFGSLIPLSVKYESTLLLPLVYGVGTAIPVIVFAFIIGFSANYIGQLFNALAKFEYWSRRITGILFILIGIYLSWEYIF